MSLQFFFRCALFACAIMTSLAASINDGMMFMSKAGVANKPFQGMWDMMKQLSVAGFDDVRMHSRRGKNSPVTTCSSRYV